MIIKQWYEQLLKVDSDIRDHLPDIKDHLPMLYRYASLCRHITEFGVRTGNSTAAFLHGGPNKLVSYDINDFKDYEEYKLMAPEVEFIFKKEDTQFNTIEETDMIFFDTIHTYDQVKMELEQHAHKARKFLMFHDTETFGEVGQDGSPGIMYAIREFMAVNKLWQIDYENKACNGLLVLRKYKLQHILLG